MKQFRFYAHSFVLAGFALSGASANADVLYSFETFDGDGVTTATTYPTTSPNGTDYINDATGGSDRVKIVSHITSSGDASNDPTGQHAQIAGDTTKTLTLIDPLSLATDGITSLEVTFSFEFNNTSSTNVLTLLYSANGTFSDKVQIAALDPSTVTYEAGQWYRQTFVISSGVAGGFTDTAKIRFGKIGSTTSNLARIDDIQILGIPEPSSLALLGLGGLLIARRRR